MDDEFTKLRQEKGPERLETILIGNDGIFTTNMMSVNIAIRR
jgi:hypothetical protein